jgi:MSHA biogenesis protein MshJ
MKEKIINKFESLSKREKILIAATGLVFIYSFWLLLALSPMNEHIINKETELNLSQQDINKFKEQAQQILINAEHPEMKILQSEQSQLQQKNQELELLFQNAAAHLMSAEEAIHFLKELLNTQPYLELLSYQSESGTLMSDKNLSHQQTFLNQPVSLKLKGDYFDLAEYLRKIETLHWHILLDEFNFKIQTYPDGIAQLKLHVLTVYRPTTMNINYSEASKKEKNVSTSE